MSKLSQILVSKSIQTPSSVSTHFQISPHSANERAVSCGLIIHRNYRKMPCIAQKIVHKFKPIHTSNSVHTHFWEVARKSSEKTRACALIIHRNCHVMTSETRYEQKGARKLADLHFFAVTAQILAQKISQPILTGLKWTDCRIIISSYYGQRSTTTWCFHFCIVCRIIFMIS
jgi:hypothetical protein